MIGLVFPTSPDVWTSFHRKTGNMKQKVKTKHGKPQNAAIKHDKPSHPNSHTNAWLVAYTMWCSAMTRWKPIFSNNLYILKTILNQPESMFSSYPLALYFQETMIWAAHFGHSINSWPVARMPFHKHRWWSLWRPFGCCIEGVKTGDVCYQGYGMRSPVFFWVEEA